jgi:DNA-binding response OmpR family regulator
VRTATRSRSAQPAGRSQRGGEDGGLASYLRVDARQPALLVVEDDERTSSFLAENLSADGFRVATASGAGEGIRAIEVRKPDLVLLDLLLEDGNGLDVLDRVRSADGLASRIDPELPIVILSGRTSENDRVRGFARGADDYVVKPFSYGELLGVIS